MTNHHVGRPLLNILPAELWDEILPYVDDLPQLAKVSTLLNERCMTLYIPRLKILRTLPDIVRGHAVFRPALLRALYLYSPCTPLLLTRLEVDITSAGHWIRRPLAYLREIVLRSPHLRDLKIAVASDVPRETIRHANFAAMRTLCSVLATIAGRAKTPVMVMWPRAVFTCRPQDIAKWDLLSGTYNPRPAQSRPWLRQRRPSLEMAETRCHDGRYTRIPYLVKLYTVHLQLIHDDCTILLVNASQISELYVGQYMPPSTIRLNDAFLRNVKLPSLRRVFLFDSLRPDPSALRQLLVNHRSITHVLCSARKIAPAPLISPPLAHPGVIELSYWPHRCHPFAPYVTGLIPGLCLSPNLNKVELRLALFAPAEALIADLRPLVERPDTIKRVELALTVFNPIELRPRLWTLLALAWRIQTRRARILSWADSSDGLQLARGLRCVYSVRASLYSMGHVRTLLPWIAAFPALEKVQIGVQMSRRDRRYSGQEMDDMREELTRQARQALVGNEEVDCAVY
ncbi:hypothetical protein MKEN_00954800 [Mycena kentingensis (nom. inval.)]|nr:hypothetical protein MKEN_00954800 [Mycena kentingensis (nom. inval.)]